MFNFSKALYWLGLVHVLLGAAIEHTRHHNTLQAIDTGIQDVEGLAAGLGLGAPPAATYPGPVIAPSPTDAAKAADSALRVADIAAASAAKASASWNAPEVK